MAARPIFAAAARTASMSAARSTNDWLTASTPAPSANSRHARSCSVNALMPRSMPGRFSPLRERSSPPTATDAFHVVARDALDDELHETVVEKEPVAGLHHARQRLEAHRDALRVADDVFIREREADRPARAGSAPARFSRAASSAPADRP